MREIGKRKSRIRVIRWMLPVDYPPGCNCNHQYSSELLFILSYPWPMYIDHWSHWDRCHFSISIWMSSLFIRTKEFQVYQPLHLFRWDSSYHLVHWNLSTQLSHPDIDFGSNFQVTINLIIAHIIQCSWVKFTDRIDSWSSWNLFILPCSKSISKLNSKLFFTFMASNTCSIMMTIWWLWNHLQ